MFPFFLSFFGNLNLEISVLVHTETQFAILITRVKQKIDPELLD